MRNASTLGGVIGMLMVGRRIGEGVVIGDNVRVDIADVADGAVKICIQAPPDVKITIPPMARKKKPRG